MQGRSLCEQRFEVNGGHIALEHAVGQEQQPVARLKRQRLHVELVIGNDPEWRVGLEWHRFYAAVAQT